MKIHITKAGRNLLVCFIIGVVIFFMCGGTAVVVKIVENYKVNSLPSVADVFSNSDISYNDWSSLKSSFTARHTEISNYLQSANDLKKSYPQNAELAKKIQRYETYLSTMNDASFDCPEHIDTGKERQYETCSNCGGSGWKILQMPPGSCKTCGGSGKIGYDVTITRNCPHCGTKYKSQISGKSLLN